MNTVLVSYLIPWVIAIIQMLLATQPGQPESGPGGQDYAHNDVHFQDFAAREGGFWLFEPLEPKPDSAHVVVFIPGYGGFNPMIYGKWIRHLVRKGNIVIFPRYQTNLIFPGPDKFADNVAFAIRDGLYELGKPGHSRPLTSKLAIAAHSYGGVISCNLAINYESYGIPPPKTLMLCSPGSGKLEGGRLNSYAGMPSDVSIVIIVSEEDWVVGDEFALKVFNEARNAKNLNLLRQRVDDYGTPVVEAHHNMPYALDVTFDGGSRSYSSKKALNISTLDVIDYFGYWKIFDAMLNCERIGANCVYAYGGTPQQLSLGHWSDGTPVKPLIYVPVP